MKTVCQFKNPGQMEVSITVETTLDNWRKIKQALRQGGEHYGPTGELRREIDDVISKVEKTFLGEVTHIIVEESN